MLENLDRLKVYYYVYTEKSVVAAAKALHVSQSAVSQTIQKLENEIKCPLFTRLHKRLVPTAAGERLYAIVQPFMGQLNACLKTIAQAKDKPFGELRIGAPVEFGKAYFPALTAAFRKQYPEVTFYLKFGDAGTLLPLVEKGRIDIAFVDEFLTQNQFFGNLDMYHFNPLAEEEIILSCSKQYYESSVKRDHSFINLTKQNFITYRQNAQTVRNWFRHHFGKYNVQFQVVLTVDSHQAIISAIRHHSGMGVVASHQVKEQIQNGQIVPINTSKPEIINQISMVQLQDKIPTFTEKTFKIFLVDKIRLMGI